MMAQKDDGNCCNAETTPKPQNPKTPRKRHEKINIEAEMNDYVKCKSEVWTKVMTIFQSFLYFLMKAFIRASMPSGESFRAPWSKSHIAMIIWTFSWFYWTASVSAFIAYLNCGERRFAFRCSSVCCPSGRCSMIAFFSSSLISPMSFVTASGVMIADIPGAKLCEQSKNDWL